MGVASGCGELEVGVASECGIYGCGCKEVYRFPHTTYTYSSCMFFFLQQHPYFLFIKKKCFSFLFQYFFVIKFYNFSRRLNTHTGDYGRPTAAI